MDLKGENRINEKRGESKAVLCTIPVFYDKVGVMFG
jgi:hypothetical protein